MYKVKRGVVDGVGVTGEKSKMRKVVLFFQLHRSKLVIRITTLTRVINPAP